METCSVVLTFEFVDEILWCDHSNENLLHGTICFLIFYKMKFGIFLEFFEFFEFWYSSRSNALSLFWHALASEATDVKASLL